MMENTKGRETRRRKYIYTRAHHVPKLVCLVTNSLQHTPSSRRRSWAWQRRDNHLATRDAPRPKTVAGAQWHRQSPRLNVTIISHAHGQGRDHWKLGSRQDEPPWPGVHNHLAVYPNLALNPLMRITSPATSRQDSVQPLEPIFITKTLPHHSKPDESVTLQIWVRHRPPTGLLSPLPPIAHANVRILPDKNTSRPFLRHISAARILLSSSSTSINPRRCALLAAGDRSFVRAHLSMTT